MINLKDKINKAATFRELKQIAENRYEQSWQPELQKDAFIDGAEALLKLLRIGVVSHCKNLTLLETIESTKQLPQVQYDLQRQLRELRAMANKLGLYDAADFIKRKVFSLPNRNKNS